MSWVEIIGGTACMISLKQIGSKLVSRPLFLWLCGAVAEMDELGRAKQSHLYDSFVI
jgi:hypothetical protein